jgi:long-chain fatty acid transport protein
MNDKPTVFRGLLVATYVFALSTQAFAGGFMVPHQTAKGVGLSNAMTGGVDDASAVYYNPAALSESVGNNILATGMYINIINSVENSGRNAVNKRDDNFLASLFANYHIPNSDFTLGIGSYTPFGLATTYEREFTRFAAQKSELKTIYVTPSASWHPSKYFSLGAGLSFVHASAVFARSLCFNSLACTFAPGVGEGRIRLTDTDNAFTYNLGALLKPTENWKIGLSYRARTDLRFRGADVKFGGILAGAPKAKANVNAFPLPPVINAGVFWQIAPDWSAEFVYEYARWSEFKTLKSTFLSGPLPGFNLPQNWKDTSTFRLGSSYNITKSIQLRGGLGLEEGPVPNRTLNPAIPSADILTLNAGVGYKWASFSFDIGYMAVFYKTRAITNSELEGTPATGIPFLGAPGKDKYRTYDNQLALSLGYQF